MCRAIATEDTEDTKKTMFSYGTHGVPCKEDACIFRVFRGYLLRYNSGTISSATMLMILISGLMAGPAVSL